MKNKTETSTLTLRLPSDLKSDLQKLADKDARSLNNYINLVLQQHVKTHNDEK